MAQEKPKLEQIKNAGEFARYICMQCDLCFRTPYDPDQFCFPKFVRNRMEFIQEFVIRVVDARNKDRCISPFRTKKKFTKIFCDVKSGICTVDKNKCNKRKRKRCFRAFSDQVLLIDIDSPPIGGKQSKKKKKKKKKKQQQQAKAKGQAVHPIDGDEWLEGYGYCAGYGVAAASTDTPEVTVIGKKKFQNKVDKILDEDTD